MVTSADSVQINLHGHNSTTLYWTIESKVFSADNTSEFPFAGSALTRTGEQTAVSWRGIFPSDNNGQTPNLSGNLPCSFTVSIYSNSSRTNLIDTVTVTRSVPFEFNFTPGQNTGREQYYPGGVINLDASGNGLPAGVSPSEGFDINPPAPPEAESLNILVHWPSSEDKVLPNGVTIPGYDGTGSPWVHIPFLAESGETNDWFTSEFPKGQILTDNQGNNFYVAYFAADGDLLIEQQVGAGSTLTQSGITGDLHASLDIDGFAHNVVLPNGFADKEPQKTTALNTAVAANPDNPPTFPGTNVPITGDGLSGGVTVGELNGSISSGGSKPTPPPPGVKEKSKKPVEVKEGTFKPASDKDAKKEHDAAAGFSYGNDDGSGVAGELAEGVTNNARLMSDGASGFLSFLTIEELDPGIEPITLDFSIPQVDVDFDWTMDSQLSAVLRKIILWLLYAAFWAGVSKRLMA